MVRREELRIKIRHFLKDVYLSGLVTKDLRDKVGVVKENTSDVRQFYYALADLRNCKKFNELKSEVIGRNKMNYYPENEELVRKEWKIEKQHNQEPQLDFRPDIKTWYEQLSYWDRFFTPWIHSRELMFEGHLPLQHEPTYSHFKKFVENKLEKNPDLCINPFDEQDKLNRKMKKFNELRDKILDEFKAIIVRKIPDFESRLPNFDENFKQLLLQLIFIRKTHEFLNRQNFDQPFSIVIEMTKNKIPDFPHTNKSEDIIEILDLLSEEIAKSQIITRRSMVELWTIVAESQFINTHIIRALKVLIRLKE